MYAHYIEQRGKQSYIPTHVAIKLNISTFSPF